MAAIAPKPKVTKKVKTVAAKIPITPQSNDWVDNVFTETTPILLDEKFSKIETPSDFKLKLYAHQETSLKALSDLENKRYVNVENQQSSRIEIMETTACILSEKLGSGKTIIILALICYKPHPIPFPENINIPNFKPFTSYTRYLSYETTNTINSHSNISMTFNSMLHPNAIVVGKSVIKQWEYAITKFTNKTYFIVCDQYSLNDFYKLYRHNNINYYDIILIKNGTVSNFYLNHETPSSHNTLRSIPDVIAQMCYNTPFARAIYDDFDTINIPNTAVKINALFTIFVSTTWNHTGTSYMESLPLKKQYDSPINLISDMFFKRRLLDVFHDQHINNIFNVRNKSEFVKESINIPTYTTYKCVYVNPNDNFISLMGNLGANELAEMLNGDAIRTAANAIGITACSPFEIFKKLLNNKYTLYMEYKTQVNVLTNYNTYISKLPPIITQPVDDNHKPRNNHTDSEIKSIIDKLLKNANSLYKNPKFDTEYTSINLQKAITECLTDITQKSEISGIEINRMKQNLKEQMCVVCKMDTAGDVDIMIPRCCSNIIGSDCFKVTGESCKCPGCGLKISIKNDIVYINHDFDVQSLLTANGDEIIEKEPEPLNTETTNQKLLALYDIINQKIPKNTKPIKINYNTVIEGSTTIKDTNPLTKILLFANYSETLEMIDKFLKGRNIPFIHLQGDYKQIASSIDQFRTSPIPILLINSQQICAGLNIQFATDIVFFHKLNNTHIEAQLIGRAQRIGRTSNLKIYFLLYTSEAQLL